MRLLTISQALGVSRGGSGLRASLPHFVVKPTSSWWACTGRRSRVLTIQDSQHDHSINQPELDGAPGLSGWDLQYPYFPFDGSYFEDSNQGDLWMKPNVTHEPLMPFDSLIFNYSLSQPLSIPQLALPSFSVTENTASPQLPSSNDPPNQVTPPCIVRCEHCGYLSSPQRLM